MMILSKWKFPQYAQEYYGGDVQTWQFQKPAHMEYQIKQYTHWLGPRIIARCIASSAVEARRIFCDMATSDEQSHA